MRVVPNAILLLFLLFSATPSWPEQPTEHWAELANQGWDAKKVYNMAAAEALDKMALAEAEKFGEDDPRLTASLRLLSDFYVRHTERKTEAIPYLEREQALLKSALGPEFTGLCDGTEMLGIAYSQAGRYADAEKQFLDGLKILPAMYDLTNKDWHSDLLRGLGQNYALWKKYPQAVNSFKEQLALLHKRYGNTDQQTIRDALYDLADTYCAAGNTKKGLELFLSCQAMNSRHPEWKHVAHLAPDCYCRIGNCYLALGKEEEALSWFQRSVDAAALYPEGEEWSMAALTTLADMARKKGHFKEALECERRALPIAERHKRKEAYDIRRSIESLTGQL